jgi:hypothetical protein
MTDLSPAAQSVMDAAFDAYLKIDFTSLDASIKASMNKITAAALRAVADQLINVQRSVEMWELHQEIHNIATELENQP